MFNQSANRLAALLTCMHLISHSIESDKNLAINTETNVTYCFFTEAISCLLKAIEIYTDMGRFTMAAKHHQSIAEIYESEAVDLERAVHHFEQAADYFRGEESNSSANKCLLKVAQYAAQLENYDKAIQIYEQVKIKYLLHIAILCYKYL